MTTVDSSWLTQAGEDSKRGLDTSSPVSPWDHSDTSRIAEIQAGNAQLRQTLDDIETAITDRLLSYRPSRFAQLLCGLRDQVAMHFTLLEARGYFGNAANIAPQLLSLARSLHAELFPLYLEADRVAEYAESVAQRPRYRRRQLAHRTLAFCDQLRRHERREDELFQHLDGNGWRGDD